MLQKLLDKLRGHATLEHHERLCIDAWRDTLSPEAQEILSQQLASAYLIQRQAEGAKICYYYRSESVPLFSATEPDLHVATVQLSDVPESRNPLKSMRAKLFLHRGRFFSVEFPKRPDRFAEQHGLRMSDLQVIEVESHLQI